MLLRFSLFPFACVIDGDGPIECFKKSWSISKGNVLLIFATSLIIFIIVLALSAPSMLLSNIANTQLNLYYYQASIVYSAIISLITAPLSTITMTFLYIKLKNPPPRIQQGYVPPDQFNPNQEQYYH
jgi:hypothetical protein